MAEPKDETPNNTMAYQHTKTQEYNNNNTYTPSFRLLFSFFFLVIFTIYFGCSLWSLMWVLEFSLNLPCHCGTDKHFSEPDIIYLNISVFLSPRSGHYHE